MMNGTVLETLCWLVVLGSAIMAGIFFIFSVSIVQSFNKLPPSTAIAAFRSLNAHITQPLFNLVFAGTAGVTLVLGAMSLAGLGDRAAVYTLVGCVLFLVGSFIITVAFNIPLNNDLDKLDPNAASSAADWKQFADSWLPWNHARTILTLGAVAAFILSIRESA